MGLPTAEVGLGNGTYAWSMCLFLRGLGVIYLLAFVSYAPQIKGLIGVSAKVRVAEPGAVPRSQGKAVRVIDKRPKA